MCAYNINSFFYFNSLHALYRTLHQVKHWLQWAVRQFNLTNIRLQDWTMTGKELYDMTLEGITVPPNNNLAI